MGERNAGELIDVDPGAIASWAGGFDAMLIESAALDDANGFNQASGP